MAAWASPGRRIRAFGWWLLVGALGTGPAWAAGLQVQVQPASVELPRPAPELQGSGLGRPGSVPTPRGPVRAWVLLRNTTGAAVSGPRVSWLDLEGVAVRRDPSAPGLPSVLRPGQEAALTLELRQTDEGAASGSLPLRVDYVAGSVPHVALASLAVKVRKPEPAEQVASAEIRTALESLQEHRPGTVYLVVTNKSEVPLEVGSIAAAGPPFIQFAGEAVAESGPQDPPLEPGETRVIPLEVRARDRVQQGKHLLVFTIPVTWTRSGRSQTRTLVATQAVSVGVLGESEVLTLLAVPSFLVLPGFLVLGMFGLFWRSRLYRRPDDALSWDLAPTSAPFWLIAIPLSFLVGLVYALLGRNLLEGYGFTDIVYVWLLSMALALLGYAGVLTYRNGRLELAARRAKDEADQQAEAAEKARAELKARTPSTGDDPLTLLEKLGRQGLGTLLPRVRLREEDGPLGFVVQPDGGAEKVWVAPGILVEPSDEIDADLEARVNAARDRHDAAALSKLLREAPAEFAPLLSWKAQEGLQGPLELPREEIVGQEPPAPLL